MDLCALSSGSLWCMGHRSTTDHLTFGPQALHQNKPNDVQSYFKSIWSSEHVPVEVHCRFRCVVYTCITDMKIINIGHGLLLQL